MTVISHFVIGVVSILVGDLLVSDSSQSHLEAHLILPTGIVTRDHAASKGRIPVSLIQKIEIIDDNLAIAASGNLKQAQKFAQHVKWHVEDHGCSVKSIGSFLDSLDHHEFNNISVILSVVEGEKLRVFRSSGIRNFKSKHFKGMIISGSGTEEMYSVVEELDGEMISGKRINPVASSMILVSKLIYSERTRGTGIPSAYGGGYEICYHNGKKFQKLDRFIANKIGLSFGEAGLSINFGLAFSLRYNRGYLDISTIVFNKLNGLSAIVTRVHPLLEVSAKIAKPKFSMDGVFHAVSLDLLWNDELIDVLHSIRDSKTMGTNALIGVKIGKIRGANADATLQLDQNWIDQLIQESKKRLLHKHGIKFESND